MTITPSEARGFLSGLDAAGQHATRALESVGGVAQSGSTDAAIERLYTAHMSLEFTAGSLRSAREGTATRGAIEAAHDVLANRTPEIRGGLRELRRAIESSGRTDAPEVVRAASDVQRQLRRVVQWDLADVRRALDDPLTSRAGEVGALVDGEFVTAGAHADAQLAAAARSIGEEQTRLAGEVDDAMRAADVPGLHGGGHADDARRGADDAFDEPLLEGLDSGRFDEILRDTPRLDVDLQLRSTAAELRAAHSMEDSSSMRGISQLVGVGGVRRVRADGTSPAAATLVRDGDLVATGVIHVPPVRGQEGTVGGAEYRMLATGDAIVVPRLQDAVSLTRSHADESFAVLPHEGGGWQVARINVDGSIVDGVPATFDDLHDVLSRPGAVLGAVREGDRSVAMLRLQGQASRLVDDWEQAYIHHGQGRMTPWGNRLPDELRGVDVASRADLPAADEVVATITVPGRLGSPDRTLPMAVHGRVATVQLTDRATAIRRLQTRAEGDPVNALLRTDDGYAIVPLKTDAWRMQTIVDALSGRRGSVAADSPRIEAIHVRPMGVGSGTLIDLGAPAAG